MNGDMNGTTEEPMETTPRVPDCLKEISSEDDPVNQREIPSKGDQDYQIKVSCEVDQDKQNEISPEDELDKQKEVSLEDDLDKQITVSSKDDSDKQQEVSSVSDLVSRKERSSEGAQDKQKEVPTQDGLESKKEIFCDDPDFQKEMSSRGDHIKMREISPKPNPDNQKKMSSKDDHHEVSIANEESDEVDSEQDSSIEEVDAQADTVSIKSDSEMGGDDTSQESHMKEKNDIIILDNDRGYNGSSCDSGSSEVQEITSDNDDECIITNTVNSVRFSSRKRKKKNFGNDFENGDNESDVEEVGVEDPLKRKVPIVISDAKALVNIANKSKNNQSNKKKGTTLVIIDNNKASSVQAKNSTRNSLTGSNLRIPPGGIPIAKATPSQNIQPSILPSLTDDMFVVEAPSFIVPYVYEKPSVKPFREFVDVLGRELEEQKAKEETERLHKEKADKERKEKEKREKLECGDEVQDSEDDDEAKKKSAEKKARRQRNKGDDDDASWDGETSSESDEEIQSDEENHLNSSFSSTEIKSKAVEIMSAQKSDNYFDCSLGAFFINIGSNLVQEFVQTDLLKQQNRKLYKEKKAGHSTKSTQTSILSLTKNLDLSKENNVPYTFPQKKCEFCSFKSESSLVLAHHLETPHMKNNVYKCNFCTFEIKSPHDILLHMDEKHHVKGRLERAPAYHQCANCPFEDNGKGKLARHLIPCAKKFKPEMNLAPPVEWEPPAKIPKITRSRNTLTGPYGQHWRGGQGSGAARSAPALAGAQFRARGRSLLAATPTRPPVSGVPIVRGGAVIRHTTPMPVLVPSNLSVTNNAKTQGKGHQPSISITPLPRQPPPSTVHPQPGSHGKSSFVICEICDGYIKDLEQLRNHMQWIHRVKIHPKMIYNRPPLNCQKCQFRFFTDQGLERHLLGSHGLVTSSMQEAANKGKDAGRCPVCGRVYQWKLLAHVARDHNLTLKPAHLSYKCTVCTATFGMYKQFENHVYSAHSVVAKRVMDKGKATPSTNKATSDSLKPMKINDEITIIPQPVKEESTSTKTK